jgi:glycine cleavage system regulatory protein
MKDLVITLIGADRPGLVEAVAATVADQGGNWLEGRMAHLAGRFAGILRVEVAPEKVEALQAAIGKLGAGGLRIVVEAGSGREAASAAAGRTMEIELLGLDRPGLVREVSRLLAGRSINVEELSTDVFSAPMTGEAMFRARARVSVPSGIDRHELRESVERLAQDLMVEIRLADASDKPAQ